MGPIRDLTWLTCGVASHADQTPELPSEDWAWASTHLPIACVDLVPVTRDSSCHVSQVGLILRHSPFGDVWCHLGGRVRYNETLEQAAKRHLSETLESTEVPALGMDPFFVNQYFPDQRLGLGHDPRKHAIAICYTLTFEEPALLIPRGEALAFQWFPNDSLPSPEKLWPGSQYMLSRLA